MSLAREEEFVVYCHREMQGWFEEHRQPNTIAIHGVDVCSPVWRIFWEQLTLPRCLKKDSVELLHSMSFTSPLLRSTKTVVTVHDLVFKHYAATIPWSKRLYYWPIFVNSIRCATKIITLSESVRDELNQAFDLETHSLSIVPAAAGQEFMNYSRGKEAQALERLCIERPYILAVATLEPRKNLDIIIQAFSELKAEKALPHKLVLCGKNGWLSERTLNVMGPQKGDTDIKWTGYVDQTDMPALYAGAELFLFPSIYEGFGFPPLEAFACGTPVVASDIPVHREVCEQGALLANPHSVGEWKEMICRTLYDPQMRSALVDKGFRRVEEFSWERTVKETLAVYHEAYAEH